MPKIIPPLTAEQQSAIRMSYLSDHSQTIKQLAEQYQVPQHRIAALLKGPEYDAFRSQFQSAMAQLAQDKLHTLQEAAVDLWAKAMPAAAAKGDHRPMRDLLQATKAIDQHQQPPQVTVNIGLSLDPSQLAIDVTPKAVISSTSPASAGDVLQTALPESACLPAGPELVPE